MSKFEYALSDAELSLDLRYRYTLIRAFVNPPTSPLGFCGLNPSTADWSKDDQTIRTEAGWTKQLAHDAFIKVNLFPFRARFPKDLHEWILNGRYGSSPSLHPDSFKFTVDYAIQQVVAFGCKQLMCCWGTAGNKKFAQIITERGKKLTEAAIDAGLDLRCIEVTKDGNPVHPLYKRITGNIHPWGLRSQGFANARF